MEFAIYSLFQIDVRNLAKNKLLICKEFNVQFSEIMKLVFFEYEYLIEDIKQIQKERETQEEAQQKEYGQLQRQMRNPMQFAAQNFKMPSAPKIGQMPSFSFPKL